MWLRTPRAKVFGYRAIVGAQCGAAVSFGVLCIFQCANPFLCIVATAMSLVTLFASSKTDFAKEVKKIVQFHDDGHAWNCYPVTDDARNVLRTELRPQLVLAGKKMIRRHKELNKFSLTDDLLGIKAARVDYENAKSAFYRRWKMYEFIGILPFKDGAEPWGTPEEFLVDLQRRMKLQKQKKSLICA